MMMISFSLFYLCKNFFFMVSVLAFSLRSLKVSVFVEDNVITLSIDVGSGKIKFNLSSPQLYDAENRELLKIEFLVKKRYASCSKVSHVPIFRQIFQCCH